MRKLVEFFSMIPAPKQKGLDYSVQKEKIGDKEIKGLCSAVIYGPNASGKTNIIGAMDIFKTIVLRGNIKNESNKNYPNIAANTLELIPNKDLFDDQPVYFSIKFIANHFLIEYSIEAYLGHFLEADAKRKILSEALLVNNENVYTRKNGLSFGNLFLIKDFLSESFSDNMSSAIALASGNLIDDELFLLNGFRNIFSSKLVSMISKWFKSEFMVIYRADAIHVTHKFDESSSKSIYIEKTITEAADYFGINSNELGYINDKEDGIAKLYSIFKNSNKTTAVLAEAFESYGTVRFVNMFPLIVKAMLNGGILVVDEFDASIHPMALMSIINIFHNDELNKNNAQLIFNTHNPIFLNSSLFRRDEIKFVERNEQTKASEHYSLSDFGTSGKGGVRKDEDFMKNYFVNRYGAIRDIDFTPIFEKILNDSLGKEDEDEKGN